jgi:hypothetical protein
MADIPIIMAAKTTAAAREWNRLINSMYNPTKANTENMPGVRGHVVNIHSVLNDVAVKARIGNYGVVVLFTSDLGATRPDGSKVKLADPIETRPQLIGGPLRLIDLRAYRQDEALMQGGAPFALVGRAAPVRTRPEFYSVYIDGIPLSSDLFSGMAVSGNITPVHWSRVIHVSESGSNMLFHQSPIELCFNELQNLIKYSLSAGEAAWRSLPKLFLTTIFGSLKQNEYVDRATIADIEQLVDEQAEKFRDDLDSVITTSGNASISQQQNVDPRPGELAAWQQIAVKIDTPINVLLGSQTGVLAGDKDQTRWEDQVDRYQNNHISANLIQPLVLKLIQFGIVPPPPGGSFLIRWPESTAKKLRRIEIANQKLNLLNALAAAGVDSSKIDAGLEAVAEEAI